MRVDGADGIPSELLRQVFESFLHVDPGRRQNMAGAGLGLTIACEIVQRAGGNKDRQPREPRPRAIVELARSEETALPSGPVTGRPRFLQLKGT